MNLLPCPDTHETRLGLAASPGAADRQPVTSCFVRLHCDERSALQIGFETGENVLNQFGDFARTQACNRRRITDGLLAPESAKIV